MNRDNLAEQMLTSVLDALPVRVFWKDRQSRLLGCNKSFAADAGVLLPADLVGKTHFEFYPHDQAEAYRADDAEVMASGCAKLAFKERLLLESGEMAWVETNKIPLRNAEGDVIGVVATYEDITEHHRAAEDLTRLIDELSIARDVAISSAASKSRFVENMIDELRAPLDVIVRTSEAIVRGADGTNADEARAILMAARQLQTLVDDLLEASKFAVEEDAVDDERAFTAVG